MPVLRAFNIVGAPDTPNISEFFHAAIAASTLV